jgi:hypothetical protein
MSHHLTHGDAMCKTDLSQMIASTSSLEIDIRPDATQGQGQPPYLLCYAHRVPQKLRIIGSFIRIESLPPQDNIKLGHAPKPCLCAGLINV